jgi:hypothetical protein
MPPAPCGLCERAAEAAVHPNFPDADTVVRSEVGATPALREQVSTRLGATRAFSFAPFGTVSL